LGEKIKIRMHNKFIYRVFLFLAIGLGITATAVCQEFMRGADISIQTRQDNDFVVYNEYGVPKVDVLDIFKNHDFNWIRIRLFHTPSGSEYGVCQDLAYVTNLGARVKAAGFKFLLDIHYSDTWADPTHQTKPAAWLSLSQTDLVIAVHDYTENVIATLRDNNAMPDMVQVGNEINCGMLWPNGNPCSGGSWGNLAQLMNAAISGINDGRADSPMPRIAVHISNVKSNSSTQWFFDNLIANGVQFDVIAQSYYPEWHGPLSNLTSSLSFMANRYSQDIVIAETADYYTGNSSRTPQSQKATMDAVIQSVQMTPNGKGIGVFYWEPTWVWNSGVGYKALFQPISGNWRNVNMLPAMEAFNMYGDITGDGIVNLDDLGDFFQLWLNNDCNATAGLDLNGDCEIDFYEFSTMARNWRVNE
jgi:arabinogalactan endo-1,4-beta-galactosidase